MRIQWLAFGRLSFHFQISHNDTHGRTIRNHRVPDYVNFSNFFLAHKMTKHKKFLPVFLWNVCHSGRTVWASFQHCLINSLLKTNIFQYCKIRLPILWMKLWSRTRRGVHPIYQLPVWEWLAFPHAHVFHIAHQKMSLIIIVLKCIWTSLMFTHILDNKCQITNMESCFIDGDMLFSWSWRTTAKT